MPANTSAPHANAGTGNGVGSIFTRKTSIFLSSKARQSTTTAVSDHQPLPATSPPIDATTIATTVTPSSFLSASKGKTERPTSRGESSPPRRRTPSRHSLSSSITEIGSNIRRSASLRSASIRSPSTTTLSATPGSTSPPSQVTGASGATSGFASTLSSFARRKKSIESIKSLKYPRSSPPAGSLPPLELAADTKPAMAAMSMTAVSMREPMMSMKRPTGTSQSNIGFGEGGKSTTDQVPALPTAVAQTGAALNPNNSFTQIQETSAKRINTLHYLRKAHEGRVYWFNTLLFTNADLRRFPSFETRRLTRRATNYLLLGFSLTQILDLASQTPTDYLRALNSLFIEFETYQSLHPPDGSNSGSLSRARIPNMFKRATAAAAGGKTRRQSSATDMGTQVGDIPEPLSAVSSQPPMSFPPPGAGNASATTMPPSDPAFSAAGWDHTAGGGGSGGHSSRDHESYALLVTPNLPFEPDFSETFATLCDVLVDVYRGIVEMVNVPEKMAPGIGDAFTKADARVRKLLVAAMVREFEDAGRAGIKQEVGGLGRVVLGGLM